MSMHSSLQSLVRTATAVATICLATCSVAQADPLKLTLGGGSVGGAWSAVGSAIGETVKREYPDTAFTYEPGRELSNILLVSQGRMQLGIAHAQFAFKAKEGGEPFKQAVSNLRAIAQIDPQATLQIVVRKDFGFSSLDAAAKAKKPLRIALNLRGTMMSMAGEKLLEASGITPLTLDAWGGRLNYVSFKDGLDMLKDGQADVVINLLAYPAGPINALAHDVNIDMLPVSDKAAAELNAALGTRNEEIPAGTYAFHAGALNTVTANVIVFANAAMSDDDAERITTAIIKHFDFLQKAHATLARLQATALPKTSPIELHPGALKAYQKAGLL